MFRTLKNFARNEKGMTLPMLGLAFMVISGFIGASVDVARLQLVQSRLSFALDAAGLAAGSTANTTNIEREVTKYLAANYPANYLGSDTPDVDVTVSSDKRVITLSASTQLPTTFMGILGIGSVAVTANTEITRDSVGLEVVMALDNTGSMQGSRIAALKTAARSMIDILYGNSDTVENLWVGLVPFSQAVNIGTSHSAWLDQTNFATLNWGPTSWGGCVDARDQAENRDVVDDPPSIEAYRAYYYASTDNMPSPYTYLNRWVTARDSNGNPTAWSINSLRNPNIYCPTAITPMTANKHTIKAGINSMGTGGSTHISLGAVWAWNMLSPRWRGLWGGEMDANNLPLDYDEPKMSKAMILMTDGDNFMHDTNFTAFGRLAEGRLGTTNNLSVAKTTLDTKLNTVCTAMKEKGIYVYSIVFGSPSTSTQTLMKGCASANNYYFHAPSNAELKSAFDTIGDSLSNLRVSK